MVAKMIGIVCLVIAVSSAAFAQTPGPRVELSMIVTDKQNKSVRSIRKEDVRLFEDNVEQTILSIETDERPVDLGIAIDNSGSFRALLKVAVDVAKLIVKNRRSDDQIFIERFISSDKIQKVADFTTDGHALIRSIDTLYVEGGPSAVVDALYTAVNYVAEHNKTVPGRRKAVVIITDGEDRNSFYTTEQLIKFLREQKVQVFVLAIVAELQSRPGYIGPDVRQKAEKLLKSVAEETGGRVFFARNAEELQLKATPEVIADLKEQFRITYQSSNPDTNPDPKKNFRRVEVKFVSTDGEKLTAIVPRGYYVQAKPDEKKSP